MDSDQEIRLARGAYNWLRASPLLTIPTLLVLYQFGSSAACTTADPLCNYQFFIGASVGILGSALWHLILLMYVNNKDSEFVRKHGRQALLYAAIRTATPLIFLVIDFLANTQGLFACFSVLILILLWLVNSKTGLEQIKKEKGGLNISPEDGTESNAILQKLKSNNNIVRLSALMQLKKSGYMTESVYAELEYIAQHDNDMDVREDARALLGDQDQSSGAVGPSQEEIWRNEMPENNTKAQQEILAKILEGLGSSELNDQMSALHDLEKLTYSSPAILKRLEQLAVNNLDLSAKSLASQLLESPVHRFIQGRTANLSRATRQLVLDEIEKWEQARLIETERAKVLRQRYNFDIEPAAPVIIKSAPAPQPVTPAPQPATPAPAPQAAAPAPAPSSTPTIAPRKKEPAAPRPTLMQTLLSETSIKVALYLGAFFVIASALILAALSEQARLPILLTATILFAAGAFALKKRLPQPSLALFIVFSFLLPINARVLADTLHLAGLSADIYWTLVFLTMTLIWAFSVWFYNAWFFSLASFVSLSLAFLRFDEIFHASADINIFALNIAALIGLSGVYALKRWRDPKFALPLFLLLQVTQAGILFASFASSINNFINADTASIIWVVITLTWLAAFAFYILSGQLFEFVLFPWASVGTLLPVAWIFLQTFHPSQFVVVIGHLTWGVLMAGASEFIYRQIKEKTRRFHQPLLPGSLIIFIAGILFAIGDVKYLFAALTVSALTYAGLMVLHPRAYVWSAALLAGLSAYFTFFHLALISALNIPLSYQFLGANILLLGPELFFKSAFTSKDSWRWPPFVLGGSVLFLSYIFLLSAPESSGNTAIILAVYSVLLMAYARHFKRAEIGYLSTASFMFSVSAAVNALKLDDQLYIVWTALAVVYYLAGILLKRRAASWSGMMRISGLALGLVASMIAFVGAKEFSGWYILIIAAMFAAEMFVRPSGWLEPAPLVLSSFALFMILRDVHIEDLSYHLLVYSLIWLGGDALLKHIFKERRLQMGTRGAGAIFAAANIALMILTNNASTPTLICFAVYTIFFAAYALFYRQPRLGYAATASLALFVYFMLAARRMDAWLPVLTGLAVIYYALGYLLKPRVSNWAETFRFSGLALASLVSLAVLLTLKPTGGWYALIGGILFITEIRIRSNGAWLEPAPLAHFSAASFLILYDFDLANFSYAALASSLIWLGGDLLFRKIITGRKLAWPVRGIGAIFAITTVASVLMQSNNLQSAVCFGVLAIFFALYAWMYRKPALGYVSTATLSVAIYFAIAYTGLHPSLIPTMIIAILYYATGYILRRAQKAPGWDSMFVFSGLGLGILLSFIAPIRGGLDSSLPVAVTATFVAFEAFWRRNVWLGFPANALYLESYFIILGSLHVDQPQYFSIGIAALGMLMHYLLTRAGSRRAAFVTGFFSQVVLLGTTYIQMAATQNLAYFAVIFCQALAVLTYGIVSRSRSLLLTPIAFSVLATMTVIYNIVKDLGTVVLVGCTGIVLLLLGITAVILRERIATFTERFKDWNA